MGPLEFKHKPVSGQSSTYDKGAGYNEMASHETEF